ncbi:MAG: Nif3-like dinuclear metal center hexameric protein [Lentimicrobiaceae bacterium]|jgi:dinuclear metal center YbgI/SA1388 family protein|nr:Nif3-like dinuclear metal center hexameric protein [Lentimicrobiaceae bacterium]
MKIHEILTALTEIAPLSFQESYDNSGLLVGDLQAEVTKTLIALDLTEAVIDEAIEKNCNLIITHHPFIFKGLKTLTPSDPIANMAIKAIQHRIGIIAMHTNIDNYQYGVSYALAEKLGLSDIQILNPQKDALRKIVVFCPVAHAAMVREAMMKAGAGSIGKYDFCSFNSDGKGSFRGNEDSNPFVGKKGAIHFEDETRIETIVSTHHLPNVIEAMLKAHPYEEVAYDVYPLENTLPTVGSGAIGWFENEIESVELLALIQKILKTPCLKHTNTLTKKIRKVALCGGSGAFLIDEAKRRKADAYLTADLKYHDYFEANNQLLLIDCGHFETEQFAKDLIADIIKKKFPTFAVLISNLNTNPVRYFNK